MAQDGTHLNDHGIYKYYKSMRGAMVHAKSRTVLSQLFF